MNKNVMEFKTLELVVDIHVWDSLNAKLWNAIMMYIEKLGQDSQPVSVLE